MANKNRIDIRLGIKYPFIQGGMANIATGEFAAAVSNAGGLGLIGAGGMKVEQLEEHIHTCRKLTDKPFGVNIMLMNPDADKMAELVYHEKIKVITTGAGNPSKHIDKWKENDTLVMPVMSSVLIAKKLENCGADYIIAEGCESGGHIGEMTTMSLVPQMVDNLGIPVIAAGGIGDGRQLLSAFALGASGVQLGTVLLASNECPIHENYKQAIIKARDNDTIVTGRIGGTPVRIIKNQMARDYVRREKEGADKMELERFTLGSLSRAVFDGDTKTGSLMAGQICGMVKEIKSIAQIFEALDSQMHETAKALMMEV